MLHFCENPGKIQSRAELLKKMTGRELKPHDRTVDVTIRRIRKHFESTPDTPEIIATIHGEGYRFCGDLDELLKKMTGRELKPHDRTVDVTIRRIRKHFESTPDTPEIISTIHGEGYRFCGDLED